MSENSISTLPRRRLGRTELMIPVVPFGTQGFGNHFGFVEDEKAVELIKHAISLGANHFDTARCYGDSQRKLGLAMKEVAREEVIITARVCHHSAEKWGGYGSGRPDYSAERTIADVEDQLEHMGIDHFDGMMIHDPPEIEPTLEKGGSLEGLLECKARGLVRNVGYGMRPHDFHAKTIATGEVDFLLCFNDFNLVRQTAAETVLPAAHQADVGVMNGWSILRGLLTGVNIDAEVEKGRWENDPDLVPARKIWLWCQEHDVSLIQLALQFCLRDQRVHGNNIGSLNIEQLEANLTAAATSLSDEVWEKFNAQEF